MESDTKHSGNIDISIIIINYQSIDLIEHCLDSIYRHKNDLKTEIIVVSNSEWGEKGTALLEKYPEITGINPGKNAGFAAANNLGAQSAAGKFLFFLNPDTLFVNDVLKELIQAAYEYPEAGIIGPYTYNPDMSHQPSVKNEFGMDHMLFLAFPFLRFFFTHKDFGHLPIKKTQYVEVVNGSAMFMSRHLFNEIGGMNESYFMYWEENDLCKSVKERGKKILFYERAKIIHLGKQTTHSVFIPMEIEKHRSQKRYLMKFHPKYVFSNRILGSITYLWRLMGSILLFRKGKVSQFGSLFLWYLFKYD